MYFLTLWCTFDTHDIFRYVMMPFLMSWHTFWRDVIIFTSRHFFVIMTCFLTSWHTFDIMTYFWQRAFDFMKYFGRHDVLFDVMTYLMSWRTFDVMIYFLTSWPTFWHTFWHVLMSWCTFHNFWNIYILFYVMA